ncbi:MAG TPA: VWA domain-containing protein [Phycisphaerales bacterium]|nr:VWA domain-containing protein [Phycisphaerales bacterium]
MNQRWLDIIGLDGSAWTRAGTPALPTFDRPAWLLMIPVFIALAWWAARRSFSGHDASTRAAHLVIRCLLIGLIFTALSEPRARWTSSDVAVVAVIDVSNSVPSDQRRYADEFLGGSFQRKKQGDRFGVVTVARDALVQGLPVAATTRPNDGYIGTTDASNLAQGIDLARSVLPADAAGRILLISDGNQTVGSAEGAAVSLAAAGIPLDVAIIDYDRRGMVRVDDVVVPAWVRDGEAITAKIVITAGEAVDGRLNVLLDGQPVDLDPDSQDLSIAISLKQGMQALSVPLKLPAGPVHRVEAVFEPRVLDDNPPELLRAEGVTFTGDRARVLILAEDASAAAPLADAVAGESVRVDTRTSSDAPSSLEAWSSYDSVILFDQSASSYSRAQQEQLLSAVRDAGTGLILVGGPSSFGAGGWIGSPLEEAIPVTLDPPQKRQLPMGALAIIVDRSGSMSQLVAGTGANQQQLANEAAILGVRALSRLDQVSVIAFSDHEEIVVPLTTRGEGHQIERAIRAIAAGGGTNLFPAIEAAQRELSRSKAPAKHIVILTDGQTMGDPSEGLRLAAMLKQQGVTISTVSIGDGSNDTLLMEIARLGGGRGYQVKSNSALAILPQIFIKEAQTVRRALLWEGPAFTPRFSAGGDSMRGLGGELPPMTGYVVTGDRGGLSTVVLRGPENDPILAQWQWGLGRVTAYTSDSAARWNAKWLAWGSFRAFWEQQHRWVSRPTGDAHARIAFSPAGEKTRIMVDLRDGDGAGLNFAAVRGRWIAPRKDAISEPRPSEVTFRQVGPGRYEAIVEARDVGTHLLALRYEAAAADGGVGAGGGGEGTGGRVVSGSARAAFIKRGGEEVRRPVPDDALLRSLAERTGGRVYRLEPAGADLWVRDHLKMPEASYPVWQYTALAAIALFLLDVAARRIALDGAEMRRHVAAIFARAPRTAGVSITGLSAARGRARRMIEHSDGMRAEPLANNAQEQVGRVQRTASTPSRRAEKEGTMPDSQTHTGSPPTRPATPVEPAGDMMSRLRAAKKRSGQGSGDRA